MNLIGTCAVLCTLGRIRLVDGSMSTTHRFDQSFSVCVRVCVVCSGVSDPYARVNDSLKQSEKVKIGWAI